MGLPFKGCPRGKLQCTRGTPPPFRAEGKPNGLPTKGVKKRNWGGQSKTERGRVTGEVPEGAIVNKKRWGLEATEVTAG